MVVEPDTGLTTAVRATKASGPENSDASVGANLLSEDTTIQDDQAVEVLADSAYGTGETFVTRSAAWAPQEPSWRTDGPL